jgi:hypothetical protein
MVWLPFSADPKEFHPDSSIKRKNVVGFAGASTWPYFQRIMSIERLNKAGLLLTCGDKCFNSPLVEYPKFVRSTTAALTSTDAPNWRNSVIGKAFEIIASGTVLLTPNSDFLYILGKHGEHFWKCNYGCTNIVERAREILNNKKLQKEISKNALKMFLNNHTTDIRTNEFLTNIKRLLKGKPLKRKWGI